jgi:hypothetical protein
MHFDDWRKPPMDACEMGCGDVEREAVAGLVVRTSGELYLDVRISEYHPRLSEKSSWSFL